MTPTLKKQLAIDFCCTEERKHIYGIYAANRKKNFQRGRMLLKGCVCTGENSGNGEPGNYKMDEYRICP